MALSSMEWQTLSALRHEYNYIKDLPDTYDNKDKLLEYLKSRVSYLEAKQKQNEYV